MAWRSWSESAWGISRLADNISAMTREVLVESLTEAYRSGSRGAAWEMGLYARPWGFRLEDIRTPVYLSHGEQDANAPAAMGRYLASVIPECQATFHAGEGHLHFVDRLPEIFAAVCP
jgi:pimeloyl-ACP methyl ester carboxylesterase